MSVEELLKPRYEVIADYPNRPITMPIGHVLVLNNFGAGRWWHEYTDIEPIHIEEGSTRFTAILRLLYWWEKREITDMPKYCIDESDNTYCELVEYDENSPYEAKTRTNGESPKWNILDDLTPISEQKYNEYIKLTTPS